MILHDGPVQDLVFFFEVSLAKVQQQHSAPNGNAEPIQLQTAIGP